MASAVLLCDPMSPFDSGEGWRMSLRELVVCSLESWDQVWRRNQYFLDGLLRRNPELRVLVVEPAADPIHAALHRHWPSPGLGSAKSPRTRDVCTYCSRRNGCREPSGRSRTG